MSKWYFTFGSDERFPFHGGWVEVEAENKCAACSIFRARYPDRPGNEGCLNCSDVYSEAVFVKTCMVNGNLGQKCHERIELVVTKPAAPGDQRPSPYERTRAAVETTGNKWASENFHATHD